MSTRIHRLKMSTKIRPFLKKVSTRIHCPQEFSIPCRIWIMQNLDPEKFGSSRMWIAKNVAREECRSRRMWIAKNVDRTECGSCRMWICAECGSCRMWICIDEQNLDKEICLIALSKNSRKGEKWIRNGKVVNIEVLPFACYKPMSSVICHVNKAFLFYYNYSYK